MRILGKEKIPQIQEGDTIRAIAGDGTIRTFKSIVALQEHNNDYPEDRVRPIDPKHEE